MPTLPGRSVAVPRRTVVRPRPSVRTPTHRVHPRHRVHPHPPGATTPTGCTPCHRVHPHPPGATTPTYGSQRTHWDPTHPLAGHAPARRYERPDDTPREGSLGPPEARATPVARDRTGKRLHPEPPGASRPSGCIASHIWQTTHPLAGDAPVDRHRTRSKTLHPAQHPPRRPSGCIASKIRQTTHPLADDAPVDRHRTRWGTMHPATGRHAPGGRPRTRRGAVATIGSSGGAPVVAASAQEQPPPGSHSSQQRQCHPRDPVGHVDQAGSVVRRRNRAIGR